MEVDDDKILRLHQCVISIIATDCGREHKRILESCTNQGQIDIYENLIKAAISIYLDTSKNPPIHRIKEIYNKIKHGGNNQ